MVALDWSRTLSSNSLKVPIELFLYRVTGVGDGLTRGIVTVLSFRRANAQANKRLCCLTKLGGGSTNPNKLFHAVQEQQQSPPNLSQKLCSRYSLP